MQDGAGDDVLKFANIRDRNTRAPVRPPAVGLLSEITGVAERDRDRSFGKPSWRQSAEYGRLAVDEFNSVAGYR
jgi:hypothetical protein